MRVAITDNYSLIELLNFTGQGEEILIHHQGNPVARLSPVSSQPVPEHSGSFQAETLQTVNQRKRQPGSATGLFTMSDDFDAPLEDFQEYM
jgi:antitoxin (DNA-binding transcriptional repressor) of toxin-antitoxin stability system